MECLGAGLGANDLVAEFLQAEEAVGVQRFERSTDVGPCRVQFLVGRVGPQCVMAMTSRLWARATRILGVVAGDFGTGVRCLISPSRTGTPARRSYNALSRKGAPETVRLVEQRAAAAGLSRTVRPLLVDADRLPLDDGVASVVLCSLVVHSLKEPGQPLRCVPRLARELRRITAPSGRLLVVR